MNDYSIYNTVNVSGVCHEYHNQITLDKFQMGSGIYAAEMRQLDSAYQGYSNARNLDPQHSEYVSTLGSLSEVAFAVKCGAMLDNAYYISYGEVGKPDFHRKGIPGDVKASARYNNLLVAERHLEPEWVYVHVRQISETTYNIVGWITGAEILEHPEWQYDDNERGLCYIAKKRYLHPFKKFIGKSELTEDNRYGLRTYQNP